MPHHIQHVVVPGTFDPITYGHIDVIARARKLFPQVTVGVAASLGKRGTGPSFTLDERVELIRASLVECDMHTGVEVAPTAEDVEGFNRYIENYKAALPIEKAAVEYKK